MKSDDEAIARLTESKRQTKQVDYDVGLEAGDDWARENASYSELRRVPKVKQMVDAWGDGGSGNYALEVWHRLPDGDNARPFENSMHEDWWEYEAAGIDLAARMNFETGISDDFVRGFVDGAAGWWEKNRDRIV
jgi:hypothetical protein